MTEKTLILICIALLLLCILLLFALLLKKNKGTEKKNDGSMEALKEKIDKLGGVADYTNKSITSLGSMTEYRLNNMQKTVNDQLRYVSENNQRALDEIRRTVDDKLSRTLETKLTESYAVIQQRLEAVYRGIGEVQSLAASVSDIKKVFSNVKLRGTWGETQLGALLSQMLAPNQYAAGVKLNPLTDAMVDFAVLLPDKNGGLVPAYEIMHMNAAIRSLIRDGKTHQIDNALNAGSSEGMISMDQSILGLYRAGHISLETALDYSDNPDQLRRRLGA